MTTENTVLTTESLKSAIELVAEQIAKPAEIVEMAKPAKKATNKNASAKPAEKAKPSKPAKKVPLVALPKDGQTILFKEKEYKFVGFGDSEEDVNFAIIHEYKNGNCIVVPTQAFYEKFESVEYIGLKKTGSKFVYTPDKKSQSIEILEINQDGKNSKPIYFKHKA